MKSSQDLQNLLRQIDHKGYPAYKDTKGKYQFQDYILSIDHVQGDPSGLPMS
jgi:predicted ABC-class ATPase